MKTIAFYLPQFHTTPENDEWWGQGYTEWTAVKKAKPLYKGHCQPKVPYSDNYYNLLEKETMQWQASLMKEYGVDGLCFYHYYFANGKKILEKPAENLLKWVDIDMPFCFSWANETWARTWSTLSKKNVWNSIEEKQDKSDGVLLKQEYGDKNDWIKHFNYLLPFFQDLRYIKKNNLPLFIIHRADLIPCLPQMMELWNELAIENGFDGIYFIGSNTSLVGLDGYIRQEANYSDTFNSLRLDYTDICDMVIRNALLAGNRTFLCGFPAYDDTPRRGKSGKIIENSTPQKFYDLMVRLYELSNQRNLDYIFINAWNEWGEGMYLEPDQLNGFGYLEALKRAQIKVKECQGYIINSYDEKSFEMMRQLQFNLYKHNETIRVLSRIASNRKIFFMIENYFIRHSVERVAVYGLGEIASVLLHMISSRVEFIIDRQPERVKSKYPVYGLDREIPNVDLIIVSLPTYFVSVYFELKKITKSKVVSIDEILSEVEEYNE